MITTCQFCSRAIELEGGLWVDPEAMGDDITWRETCDSSDTFAASHEPGETQPQHLTPEFWAECLELREYLANELDGLILGVGLQEPGSDKDAFLTFYFAPNNACDGVAVYNREAAKWLIMDKDPAYMANVLIEIPTLGRPALLVSALLRAAVELLDAIE
jgi:hypothetical protein